MGKRLTIALAVFALVVVPLSLYAAGYFFLPVTYYKCYGGYIKERDFEWYRQKMPDVTVELVERGYPQRWMQNAFRPAAKLEGWLRGVKVEANWVPPARKAPRSFFSV